MGHHLGFRDGASFTNPSGDRAGNSPKQCFKLTGTLHHPTKRGACQGLAIRTTIGIRRGQHPTNEFIVGFRNSRQDDGSALGVGIARKSCQRTPWSVRGLNTVGNLFKLRYEQTMAGDFPCEAELRAADRTISRPAFELIMGIRCGRDGATHTRGRSNRKNKGGG